MKNLRLSLCVLLVGATVFLTGCQAFSDWYSDHRDEIYEKVSDKAVTQLEYLIDTKVNELIVAGKVTEQQGVELKAACKQAVKDAFKRIDELRQQRVSK